METQVVLNKPLIIFKALLSGAEVKMGNGYTYFLGEGVKTGRHSLLSEPCLLIVCTITKEDGSTEPHYIRSDLALDDFIHLCNQMDPEQVLQVSVANVLRNEARK